MLTAVLLLTFAVLVLLGSPIGFAIGIASAANLIVKGIDLSIVVQRMTDLLDSFPFLAVPLFILAGSLMETGGIAVRLVQLANVLVGRFQGGLAQVTIMSTMFFSDISGSSSADTAAIGSVTLPAMRRAGYPMDLSTALVAAAGATAVLIPPCITMVIYGFVTDTSIGALFAAGFLPGFLNAAGVMIVAYILARRRGLPAERAPTFVQAVSAIRGAVLPLAMPVIILGGILGGLFTVTEAAAVAVVYGLIVSVLITHELKLTQIPRLMIETGVLTGMVMIVAALASVFQWILSAQGIPVAIGSWLRSVASGSPVAFLLLVNGLLLLLGTFLDSAAALLLAMPVLYPISQHFGIDPVHFGIIVTANLGIGMITPPVGVVLFVASSIGKTPIEDVVRSLMPFIIVLVVVLMVITFWPDLVLLVPRAFLGYAPRP